MKNKEKNIKRKEMKENKLVSGDISKKPSNNVTSDLPNNDSEGILLNEGTRPESNRKALTNRRWRLASEWR